jgi:hypothetical protein
MKAKHASFAFIWIGGSFTSPVLTLSYVGSWPSRPCSPPKPKRARPEYITELPPPAAVVEKTPSLLGSRCRAAPARHRRQKSTAPASNSWPPSLKGTAPAPNSRPSSSRVPPSSKSPAPAPNSLPLLESLVGPDRTSA